MPLLNREQLGSMTCKLKCLDLYVTRRCNLRCSLCSTGCQWQPPTETTAEQYEPWLKEMRGRGISWKDLNVLGGEPTLHPDLPGLLNKLRPYGPLMLTTNGTWLGRWQKFRESLSCLNTLTISGYPSVMASVDGWNDRIGEIREAYPKLDVRDIRVGRFLRWGFRKERQAETGRCHGWKCSWLGTDGRVARCWAALHLECNPEVTPGFREACGKDMFYDLSKSKDDFGEWYGRRPFEACWWCDGGRKKWTRWSQGASRVTPEA